MLSCLSIIYLSVCLFQSASKLLHDMAAKQRSTYCPVGPFFGIEFLTVSSFQTTVYLVYVANKFIFFSFAINFHSTRCNFLVRVNPDKLRGITHVRGKGYKQRITFVIGLINQQDLSRKCSAWKELTLSAPAPWDVIDSRGGVQSARICKTSLNHHLTMKFCIYPQDVFRTRL